MIKDKNMDTQSREEIKDFMFQAIQATKQENSGLLGEIKRNVNLLQQNHNEIISRLQRQDLVLSTIQNEQARVREELTKYKPYLEGLASISVSGKIVLWIAIFLSTLVGTFYTIKSFLKP